ncbi:heavy metal translocating P-type ATPase [Litorisediminicola beolgyonensis]|uniref:Heavy metal translocating P-type ATPase n=1 Tax=Litorisediminicola beolgyonensis TaxID=1173614 RepID=A0ABW3ZHF5_9RHOB
MTAACPACAGLPEAEVSPETATGPSRALHLPDIHCAACIAKVEDALGALPGVRSARVNLTLKRVQIDAPGVADATLIDALASVGQRAQRLDAGRLGSQEEGQRDLLTRIGVAGFAMMNVMLLSVAVWSGAMETTAQLFHLVSAAIAVPAIAFSARPFFVSAFRALGAGALNMDVPISLAIALAAASSTATAFGLGAEEGWFDAALALTFFLLVGRYLDQAGRRAARSAAAELAALEAPQAVRLDGGTETVVDAANLRAGDLIRVRPGDRLPADGIIETGLTDLDRSALTGESRPEAAGPGESVSAGETCLTGTLTVRVLRAGEDTGLARMAALVATAESQKFRHKSLADRAARLYAPVVHLLGAAAFLGWLWLTGDGWRALDVAISVLVITCPCALGLAIPAVSTVTTARLFRAGLLVTSRTALERLAEIDIVVFDKTGTLTSSRATLAGTPPDHALALAAGLASASRHPVATAIRDAAVARGIAPLPVEAVTEVAGLGIEGYHDGARLRLGRAPWAVPGETGGTWLSCEGEPPLRFELQETLRPEAADTIAQLRAAGYEVALLSGDTSEAVAHIASALGIDRAEAGLRPEDKVAWVEARQAEGRHVLMVGDGLNDTGCLSVAHAGIAPGTALDAARSAADVVLLSGDLTGVPLALRSARTAVARMRQNLGLAALYNAISIPVALAGFATPLLAALAMSASSLTVSLNAARRST